MPLISPTGCILFHFYIKPQPLSTSISMLIVVSYSISTSNHNPSGDHMKKYLVVSYSISTSNHNLDHIAAIQAVVVSYSISTSNHNKTSTTLLIFLLYLIPFLHQTTTLVISSISVCSCILFHFYIKPQPMAHKTLFSSTLSPKSHSHFQRNAVV